MRSMARILLPPRICHGTSQERQATPPAWRVVPRHQPQLVVLIAFSLSVSLITVSMMATTWSASIPAAPLSLHRRDRGFRVDRREHDVRTPVTRVR